MTEAHATLEYVRVPDLPDHPDNPRVHNLAELRTSIRRFGFTTPALLDERTGLLAEGHGRKKALLEMMSEQGRVPDQVLVDDDGVWKVPVRRGWSSQDDSEARAYLLASNQGGGWNADLLVDILGDLAAADALHGTGFDADDLDDYLAELGAGELPDQGTDADHAPLTERGEPAPPRNQQGVHEVGLVYQGDAYREFQALIAVLRARWKIDHLPELVMKALQECEASAR